MPNVVINFGLGGGGTNGAIAAQPNALTMVNENGETITLPLTAPTTNYGELASAWTQVARPGLVEPAFNVKGPRPLRVLTFQVTVVVPQNFLAPIDTVLNTVTKFLQDSNSIRISYFGIFESSMITPSNQWVCTSWQPSVITRDPATNSAISAQGNLVLTEANPQPFAPQPGFTLSIPSKGYTLPSPVAASSPASVLMKGYPSSSASTASGTATIASRGWNSSVPASQSTATGQLGTPALRSGISKKYIVKAHDSWEAISQYAYGSTIYGRAIKQANNATGVSAYASWWVGKTINLPSGTPAATNNTDNNTIFGNLTIPTSSVNG